MWGICGLSSAHSGMSRPSNRNVQEPLVPTQPYGTDSQVDSNPMRQTAT